MKKYNNLIDVIIPAYNVEDKILSRCLASIACQDIVDELEVTIVDDASTQQNYAEVISRFAPMMKINLLRYEVNGGPGVARQYGLDNTSNGLITFIDADDTFNGAFALHALRTGIDLNPTYQMCVGVFDEIHEHNIPEDVVSPLVMEHANDLVWMFGKLYRRAYIDKYNIRFHETSRANEDNGFNTICRLCSNEQEQINFINAHVYYWHENLNSITRQNNCQYSYGSSERDSFYGYVENMIYAIKEARQRNPYNGYITMWSVSCLLNIYQYYIECVARAPEHAPINLKWCKRYYDEIYSQIEDMIPQDAFATQYNEVIRNAYLGDKLNGIIPAMGIYEFLNTLKTMELEG